MNFIKILHIVCIVSVSLFAQSNNIIQYEFADSLLNAENYFDAITEFKRLRFFDDDNTYEFVSTYNIGMAYKAGGYYDNSIKFLTLAGRTSGNDSVQFAIQIEVVKVNILRRSIPRALELLYNLNEKYSDSLQQNEINYWKGWAHIFNDDWDKAQRIFSNLNIDADLKKTLQYVVNQKFSINFAKTVSFIVPGSGYIYLGNYVQGLISLGWNVLWGYLTINSFVQDRALDGILIGSLLWLRFYRGGAEGAEKLAIEKNLEISNKALLYLQNNYKGQKP